MKAVPFIYNWEFKINFSLNKKKNQKKKKIRNITRNW